MSNLTPTGKEYVKRYHKLMDKLNKRFPDAMKGMRRHYIQHYLNLENDGKEAFLFVLNDFGKNLDKE